MPALGTAFLFGGAPRHSCLRRLNAQDHSVLAPLVEEE